MRGKLYITPEFSGRSEATIRWNDLLAARQGQEMDEEKYTPEIADFEGHPYIKGPGREVGYNAGYLFGDHRPTDHENAAIAARIANMAYWEGYRKAQADIRSALGVQQ